VIARGIYYAAHANRREFWIGLPTVMAIQGEKLVPGLADHYLGDHGYESQMTDEPVSPNRPNNLWEPLPGDHGAHGRFDAQARSSSWQLKLNMHRGLAAACVLGMAAGLLALWRSSHEETGMRKAA